MINGLCSLAIKDEQVIREASRIIRSFKITGLKIHNDTFQKWGHHVDLSWENTAARITGYLEDTNEQSWLLLVPASTVPLEVTDWVIRFSKSHKSSLTLKILTAEARGLTDLSDSLGTAITI